MGYRWGECAALKTLGRAHSYFGEYRLTLEAYAQARIIAQEIGEINMGIEIAAYLSQLYTLLGNPGLAGELLQTWVQNTQERLAVSTQFASLTAALLLNQFEGKLAQAYQAATQAWGLACETNNPRLRTQALVYLGHVQVSLQQIPDAADSYQLALTTEARAGLAQLALAQDNLAETQAWVEEILPNWAAHPHAGFNTPFFAYLTCYQVLAVNADPRAALLLQQSYDLLQQDAAALDDETRQRFLEEVPHPSRPGRSLYRDAGAGRQGDNTNFFSKCPFCLTGPF